MRSRVFLMVALLAIAGIMAAMAYTEAEVRNPAEATIVRTDVALLALSCKEGVGNLDEACWVDEDGRMHLNFRKGLKEDGEPSEEEPVVIGVSETRQSVDGYNPKERWYKVTLTDDQGHEFSDETKNRKSYEVKDFKYDIDGRCIDYSFQALTKKSGSNQWVTVSGRICIPAKHTHQGEPGESKSGFYGFQPGSTYTFADLAKVTNNSEETIDVSAVLPEGWAESGMEISVTSNGKDLTDPSTTIRLASGESAWITFVFNVPDDWAEQQDKWFPTGEEEYPFGGMFIINAVAVDGSGS